MTHYFSNKTDPKEIREKFERLKYLYDAVEKLRLQNGLTVPPYDENKWEVEGDKELPAVMVMPMFDNCKELWNLVVHLQDEGWQIDGYDIEEGQKAVGDLGDIHNADFDKVRRLLTYFLRGERFCDGHWERLIENGFMRSLLDRLQIIIQEIDENLK